MFQNVFMDPKVSKEKQMSLFFSSFLESLCLFIYLFIVSFQFHTHVYM
jgi:hypothetical protein